MFGDPEDPADDRVQAAATLPSISASSYLAVHVLPIRFRPPPASRPAGGRWPIQSSTSSPPYAHRGLIPTAGTRSLVSIERGLAQLDEPEHSKKHLILLLRRPRPWSCGSWTVAVGRIECSRPSPWPIPCAPGRETMDREPGPTPCPSWPSPRSCRLSSLKRSRASQNSGPTSTSPTVIAGTSGTSDATCPKIVVTPGRVAGAGHQHEGGQPSHWNPSSKARSRSSSRPSSPPIATSKPTKYNSGRHLTAAPESRLSQSAGIPEIRASTALHIHNRMHT